MQSMFCHICRTVNTFTVPGLESYELFTNCLCSIRHVLFETRFNRPPSPYTQHCFVLYIYSCYDLPSNLTRMLIRRESVPCDRSHTISVKRTCLITAWATKYLNSFQQHKTQAIVLWFFIVNSLFSSSFFVLFCSLGAVSNRCFAPRYAALLEYYLSYMWLVMYSEITRSCLYALSWSQLWLLYWKIIRKIGSSELSSWKLEKNCQITSKANGQCATIAE